MAAPQPFPSSRPSSPPGVKGERWEGGKRREEKREDLPASLCTDITFLPVHCHGVDRELAGDGRGGGWGGLWVGAGVVGWGSILSLLS